MLADMIFFNIHWKGPLIFTWFSLHCPFKNPSTLNGFGVLLCVISKTNFPENPYKFKASKATWFPARLGCKVKTQVEATCNLAKLRRLPQLSKFQWDHLCQIHPLNGFLLHVWGGFPELKKKKTSSLMDVVFGRQITPRPNPCSKTDSISFIYPLGLHFQQKFWCVVFFCKFFAQFQNCSILL